MGSQARTLQRVLGPCLLFVVLGFEALPTKGSWLLEEHRSQGTGSSLGGLHHGRTFCYALHFPMGRTGEA